MLRPRQPRTHRTPNLIAIAAALLLFFSDIALAYIGPGAGGSSGGIGWGGIIFVLIACGLGLCLLCGLIAAVIAAKDKFKTWAALRNEPADSINQNDFSAHPEA